MSRIDPDDSDACTRGVSARNGELEIERTRAADDPPVLPRCVHALEPDAGLETLDLLVRRRRPEVLADGEDGFPEFVVVGHGTDVERHLRQKTSGQNGGRGVRKSALARSSAP